MTETHAPAGSRAVADAAGADEPLPGTARGTVLAAAAALLAVSALMPPYVTAVVVGVAVLVFAWGWPHLLGLPGAPSTSIVVALVGIASVVGCTVMASARPVVPALGLGVLAAFLQQMLRKDGRENLTDSIAGTVSGLVIAASGGAWVALEPMAGGVETLLVASAAMCAGALAHFLPAARPVVVGAIMLLAALVGLGVGALLHVSLIAAGAVGLAVGGLMAACLVVFVRGADAHAAAVPAAALAPLLAIGLPVMQAVHLLN